MKRSGWRRALSAIDSLSLLRPQNTTARSAPWRRISSSCIASSLRWTWASMNGIGALGSARAAAALRPSRWPGARSRAEARRGATRTAAGAAADASRCGHDADGRRRGRVAGALEPIAHEDPLARRRPVPGGFLGGRGAKAEALQQPDRGQRSRPRRSRAGRSRRTRTRGARASPRSRASRCRGPGGRCPAGRRPRRCRPRAPSPARSRAAAGRAGARPSSASAAGRRPRPGSPGGRSAPAGARRRRGGASSM